MKVLIRVLPITACLVILAALITTSGERGQSVRNDSQPADQSYTNEPGEKSEATEAGAITVRRAIDDELLKKSAWGHLEEVKALLNNGADANTRADNGDTPLITATSYGYGGIVKLLLESGADVNAGNSLGNTALIQASTMNRAEIAEMLLGAGADANAKNINGSTALDIAETESHDNISRLIKAGMTKGLDSAAANSSSVDKDSNLQPAPLSGNANARDRAGWTPLMRAASRNDRATAELLLANGADPNLREYTHGRTALIIATIQGHSNIVQALLARGADCNIRDNLGNSALSYSQEYGHPHIGKLLKQAGARAPSYNQLAQ